MADIEKPHFPRRVLSLAEDAQKALGNSAISKILISAVTGSSSPAYRQLKWESKDVTADAFWRAMLPGDPSVRRLTPARMWHNASVIKTANFEADPAWEQGGVEAIAYMSDGVTHVGTLPDEETLFNPLNDKEVAIGMRLGSGAVDAAMGIWLPYERHFIGSPNEIQHAAPLTPVSTFQDKFPGILLA